MKMSGRRGASPTDAILNGLIALMAAGALLFAGRSAWLLFRPSSPSTNLEFVTRQDWRQIADGGRRVGPPNAAVVVTVFGDYQCPYCAELDRELESIRERHKEQVAVVQRHFPLSSIHAHAFNAAVAAECAARHGRFEQFHHALFRHQDSLGTRSWSRIAAEAGVQPESAFERCLGAPEARAKVEADLALARSLRLDRTPVLLVNERFYQRATPTPGEVSEIIEALLRASR